MRQVPRVAAVHDISGVGRCSMTVVLPVLSALGAQCCALPTAFLSAHMGFPPSRSACFLDMTDQMARTADHWEELALDFGAVYSGFLGSSAQIGVLKRIHETQKARGALLVVDPVMGDHGRAYRTCTPDLCAAMGQLAAGADLITPNLTEAALLLGEDYAAAPADEAGIRAWLERLSLKGERSVVLTGVSLAPGQLGAACLDRSSGEISFCMGEKVEASYPGTGDLFAAVVVGSLLQGVTLRDAVERAVDFVSACAQQTLALGTPTREGVAFEGLLHRLTQTN